MLGVTLGLFAAYLAAAGLALVLARRFVAPVRAAAALFLLLAPLAFTGRAVWTGGVLGPVDLTYEAQPLLAEREALRVGPTWNPVLSDVVYQMLPWQRAVREALAAGRAPLWNRFLLAGEPLLAAPLHGALHPTFWLGLPLPLPQAWTLSMSLRVFLALLCAYLFFRELSCGEIASLFGACAWAFCDYLLFFLGYPQNPTVAAMPLLLVGLRRLARSPGRPAAAITIAALLLMTTGGHFETLLHGVAGAGIYFLFEIFRAGIPSRARSVLLALGCGVLTLAVCAVVLLPFREALPQSDGYRARARIYARSERSVPVATSLERSAKNVIPYALGVVRLGQEKPGFGGAAGYAGAVLLPLACVGLFSARREKWPLLLAGFLGLSAWARLPVVNDALCRLPLFDLALNEYMAFWGAFAVVALAVFGLTDAGAARRSSLLAAIGGTLLGILFLYRHALPNLRALPPGQRVGLLLVQIVPIAILGVFLLLAGGRLVARALPGLVLGLLVIERVAEMGSFYPTVPARAFYPPLPILDRIPRGEPWRMAGLGLTFIPNVAALYDLEDVRGYDTMALAALVNTFPLWCVPQPVWFNRIDDPTRPFLSFLSVRYVLADRRQKTPPGWRVLDEQPGGRLLENPNALPRAFVPRRLWREPDPRRQIERLSAIGDFASEGVVEGTASGPIENGSADVCIASYEPQRMELSVDAREPSLIATSVTGWKGWRLFVEGEERPLLSYNHAFLAFEVPAGRHRAVLRYWPRSFVAGLWISGIAIFAAIAIFAWPCRTPAPRPAGG